MIFLYPAFSNWYYKTYIYGAEAQRLKDKFIHWNDVVQNKSESNNLLNKDLESLEEYNEKINSGTENFSDPFLAVEDSKNTKVTIDYNSDEVFGIIEIPKIDQELPIYLGASREHLLKGVGQVQGTSLPVGGVNTNSVLAAHSGFIQQKLFTDLPKLEKGDIIIITNKFGVFNYEVTGNKVILPSETQYLSVVQNKDMITLLTCYLPTKENDRLVVFAERVSDNGTEASEKVQQDNAFTEYSDEITVKPRMEIFQLFL